MYNGPFYHHFCTKTDSIVFQFATSECHRYPKPTSTVVRIDLSYPLLSAYQEYLVTFKLMTSQVVQRAQPLRTYIYVLGSQRVTDCNFSVMENKSLTMAVE